MSHLNIVTRVIAGFSLLGALIVAMFFLSFFGLNNIKFYLESVIEKNMPLQEQLLMSVQIQTLKLSNKLTLGFYDEKSSPLQQSISEFEIDSTDFKKQLQSLSNMLSDGNNVQLRQGTNAIDSYVSSAQQMYKTRRQLAQLDGQIDRDFSALTGYVDDASANVLDLAFIDSATSDPRMASIIGFGNTIDFTLVGLLDSAEGLLGTEDEQVTREIVDELNILLADIASNQDPMVRDAQGVETEGLIDGFNESFDRVKGFIQGTDNLPELHFRRLALRQQAYNLLQQSQQHLLDAVDVFEKMSARLNQNTSDGQDQVLNEVTSNITTSFAIVLFALLSGGSIVWIIYKDISSPLNLIRGGLKVIASGNLTLRLDDSKQDEFGELAQQVNTLADNLTGLVKQIQDQQKTLQQATEQSATLMDKSQNLVDTQRKQIRHAAQSTEQIRQLSQNNVHQTHHSRQFQIEATSELHTAVKVIEKAQDEITGQQEQANQSVQVIKRLSDNSVKISSILDVIKTIAEQTNLLALNAAIEAARAGEQGRGFAVVADEVRTLANRTQQSTTEIESMIKDLQSDAEMAVDNIETGREQAIANVDMIKDISGNIHNIDQHISHLDDINQQIVQDIKKQDGLLQDISIDLDSTVRNAEESASCNSDATVAALQIQKQMQELQTAVSKFQL